ncbi:alcohol dehydrogenase GroES-like protein [Aeromonas diversa CDC 2478-85]|uniref:Alcohol dehydrogenase GroES-like protein n=1 Tax=Aeromonas diversa CDC 2478-85 TaxID=1268237 RepID=N9VGI3_9GAMM|nr:alcohol dehydrogenase catalytic domain-containing protein [Aeromonas diversa]ENY70516.1 alcohol dehydrogenase GroES-like protein [Aeromonas diversa CDC 2478-85]
MHPITTQGWCWHAPGEPDTLTLTDLTLPAPGPGEVLVENRVIAINPVDWKLIEWGHGAWQAGQVPGVDGMGVIAALGEGVSHLRLGSRVAYHTDLRRHGSFARHTCVPARALLAVPDALSDEAAAAFPCPGLTAWQALAKLPALEGEALLITGAASNVGRYAIALGRKRGARLFASAEARHHEALRRLGVTVADYHDANWLATLLAANGGEPFHAAIDLVSSAQAAELCHALGYYGHLVAVLGRIEQSPLPPFSRCLSLHEIALGAQHAHGSDRQWQQLVRAGESMLAAMVSGAMPTAPLALRNFTALPAALAEAKQQGRGRKFLLTL